MATRSPLDSAPRPSLGSHLPPPGHDRGAAIDAAGRSPDGASTRGGRSGAAREQDLVAAEMVAFLRGTTGGLRRWARGWERVGLAYKREGDFAAAKRCDDNAVKLRAFQRAEARAQAVAS